MTWVVPEPASVCDVYHDDGSVTKVRRHGNPSGLRLLLCHGNGLAIDFYYPFWSLLLDEFDLLVYDMRNHGWNAVGRRSEHIVPNLIRDEEQVVEGIEEHYGSKPTVGVFHSMSALTTLLSMTLGTGRAGTLSGWVLFDPPLFKPNMDEAEFDASTERKAELLSRRGHRFDRIEQFTELLTYVPLLMRAVPGAADLMARTVLRESSDGKGYELRCPRDYEAQIAAYSRTFSALANFNEVPCPTKVIGSDPTLPYTYMPTFDLSHILTIDYDFLPETTHLLQVEQPAECVALMREFFDDSGLPKEG